MRPALKRLELPHVEFIEAGLRDDGIRRYHDPDFDALAVKVLPGEHYVTSRPEEMLVTVLGSCVSACIRDPSINVGGMNHFVLPSSPHGDWGKASTSLRYGNFAMERLINDILKRGGRRERFEVKIFGGGNVLALGNGIGHLNADFVESYLEEERLPVAARHLRGTLARRIHYFPQDGRVLMSLLRRSADLDLLRLEARYTATLSAPAIGTAELFE